MPKDIEVELIISKKSGTKKLTANSNDINSKTENFLKSKGYQHLSVIEVREQNLIPEEIYSIKVRGVDSF